MADVLPFVTSNPARALKLPGKGRIAEGADADLLLLDRDSLEVAEVFARGRRLVDHGRYREEAST